MDILNVEKLDDLRAEVTLSNPVTNVYKIKELEAQIFAIERQRDLYVEQKNKEIGKLENIISEMRKIGVEDEIEISE